MVDRGGLNYPIRARDEFSKTTKLFRTEIRASKKEFREFQKVLKGGGSAAKQISAQAKATRDLAKAQAQLAKATRATTKPLTDEEKALRALAQASKEQAARERESVRIRRAQEGDRRRHLAQVKAEERAIARAAKVKEREARAAKKAADAINPEVRAREANRRAALAEATAVARVNQAKEARRAAFNRRDIRGFVQANRQVKELTKNIRGSNKAAGNLLFTFRRLVGTLAIFTAARRAFQGFVQLVKSGVQFNDVVATSQLGIAGLVITLGDVRNAAGETVDNAEKLGLALGIAREQTALLRQDSLKTVATFEQLLDTFQVSVGPGLAAGLDLDEVRQLTVDISQAASALGVPQNQLAEEVRSLLSGTIQARTTRIATALGISNEDVRNLKEAGTLFEVLEEKFEGFADAAEKQARTTFSGITTLLTGLLQEVLGAAAAPLFQELIDLGNELFDNVLSVRDELGNIRPSPEAVAAFAQVFDAIKRSVAAFAELGGGDALSTLDSVLAAVATTIDIVTGAVIGLIKAFQVISDIISGTVEFLGLTNDELGIGASKLAEWGVQGLVFFKVLTSILPVAVGLGRVFLFISKQLVFLGVQAGKFLLPAIKKIGGGFAIWITALVAIVKGFEIVFSKITGVNLNIKDTIQLIAVSMFGAWLSIGNVVKEVALKIVLFMENAIDKVITAAKNKASVAKGFIAALFGSDTKAQAEAKKRLDRELARDKRIADRKQEAALELADIELTAAAERLAIEEEIAKIIGDRAGKNAQGPGFDPDFDPNQLPDVGGGDLPDAPTPPGSAGAGGGTLFGRARIDDNLLKKANELTGTLEAQAAAERAKTAAVLSGLGARDMALVAAQNALDLSRVELSTLEEKNALELAPFRAQRAKLAADSVELANLNEFIEALEVRQGFEEEILRLRTLQLEKAKEEADLVANGSLSEGLQRGFEDLAESFGSQFQAGIDIATTAINGFTQFASQAIVDAFDPTKDSATIKENFARLLQQIAQVILQKLIELAIAKAIIEAGFGGGGEDGEAGVKNASAKGVIEVTTATTVAAIRLANAQAIAAIKIASGGGFSTGGEVSLASGGIVPPHFSQRAQGLAGGGMTRPAHIPASDTVPAWLTPGEFVMNKASTSRFLPLLEGMNGGNMNVVGSSSAEAAGPSAGMARGGLVSDQLASAATSGDGGSATVVVPAIVARDGEMDKLTAGGRNAMMAFMRENAGNINSLLDRSNGRG